MLSALQGKALDERLLNAATADARETLRRAAETLCKELKSPQTIKMRHVSIATVLDWIRISYPYTPRKTTGRDIVEMFCGEEQRAKGNVKATRAARNRIAHLAVTSDSYAESAHVLHSFCGMSLSRETVRKVTNEVGRRTQEELFSGKLIRFEPVKWHPPKGAKRVPETFLISPDGTCFPCTKTDLQGRMGRNGGQATGRNANVVCFGRYEYVNAKGRPIFAPGSLQYYVLGEGGAEFGKKLWQLAEMEDIQTIPRIEFISDGEKELENVYQEQFAGLANVSRAVDAMHACGYVDELVKEMEPEEKRAVSISKRLRKRLVNASWKGFEESFFRRYGQEAVGNLTDKGHRAWNYLLTRAKQMDYQNLRRRHMVIGSGMAEVGCKLTVGARLKGPGMHWRFQNGIRVALLRGLIRSHRQLAI